MKTLAQRLRELAADANRKASDAIARDAELDAFYQGRRSAFLEAAELVENEE